MMSDLTQLRDHAQRMAKSDHVDDCERIHRITKLISSRYYESTFDVTLSCPSEAGHDPHSWVTHSGREFACPGLCGGCMTERERKLWHQIADEIGEHFNRPAEADQGALPL